MLRIGNQMHRAGVRDVLKDLEALAARLRAYAATVNEPGSAAALRAGSRPAPEMSTSGQYLMAL